MQQSGSKDLGCRNLLKETSPVSEVHLSCPCAVISSSPAREICTNSFTFLKFGPLARYHVNLMSAVSEPCPRRYDVWGAQYIHVYVVPS